MNDICVLFSLYSLSCKAGIGLCSTSTSMSSRVPVTLQAKLFALLATELAVGLVVGGELIADQSTGAVGVEVVGHVVALGLHVGAHLVEG